MRRNLLAVWGAIAGLLLASLAQGADWPSFRHDRKRTSATDERIAPPLEQIWLFRSQSARLAPKFTGNMHADITPEHNRTTLPITAAGDALFFTSQSEGRIVCLDAATGNIRWQFVSGAGMQRAATIADGRVYAGSDDGYAYCLDAKTGAVVWKHKAAPADRWFFSYGRLISVWPVRTDVVVDPSPGSGTPTAYFGAGIFPHDGTFLYAVDAKTGERVWWNNSTCETNFRYSLSPHGHLYVTGNHIYVPMDFKSFRWGIFNAYRRADGSHNNWGGGDPENPGNNNGGAFLPLVGAQKDGKRYGGAAGEGYNVDLESIQGILPGVRGAPIQYDPDLCPVIYAGGIVYNVAYKPDAEKGVTGRVYARDATSDKALWAADVAEWPNQIIAAQGRVFVSTRCGTIYAFAPTGAAKHGTIEEPVTAGPSADAKCAQAANAIVKESGAREGYALVLDCDSGMLAYELARTTNLSVIGIFSDEAKAQAARADWVRAGLHVTRLLAIVSKPGHPLPLPAFFADLVVSEAAARGGALPADAAEVVRVLKPIYGKSLLGGTQQEEGLKKWTAAAPADLLTGSGPADWAVSGTEGSRWASWTRPRLKEGGGWADGLGDAGNSMCSQDGVLKPPLGVLWHGRPYSARNDNGMSPSIIIDGVLVNQFLGKTEAFDAYTGRDLWRLDYITDTIASPGSIFLRFTEKIARVEPRTGRKVAEFAPPLPEGKWSGMAASADGAMLYALAAAKDVSAIVAIEVKSGRVLWTLGGPGAPKQWPAWNAISDGRLYFLGGKAEGAMRAEAVADMRAWLAKLPDNDYKQLAEQMDKHDIGVLTAVDGLTGKVLYERGVDLTNAGGGALFPYISGGRDKQQFPYILSSIQAHGGAVIFGTAGQADKLWAVWPGGGYKHRAISVYDGATCKLLWFRFGNYRSRLAVTDDFVIAEPWAFHLKTGEPKMREHPATGLPAVWSFFRPDKHCGIFNASRYFVFGRSRGIGYHDLLTDQGLYTFIHSRASCGIDTSSGSGVMIKPPHAIGCRCEISMPFTVALGQVRSPLIASQLFSQSGANLPVKHLYLDFGATGDRRDAKGNLWMPPRPQVGLMLGSDAGASYYEGGGAVQRSSRYSPIENTDTPFVFATVDRGLKECKVPLTDPKTPAEKFIVRLGFSALPGDKPGQRVFDVILNGQTVLKDFDIMVAAGKADRAVWKEFPVTVQDSLVLGLVTKGEKPTLDAMPLISGMVVVRQ